MRVFAICYLIAVFFLGYALGQFTLIVLVPRFLQFSEKFFPE